MTFSANFSKEEAMGTLAKMHTFQLHLQKLISAYANAWSEEQLADFHLQMLICINNLRFVESAKDPCTF